MNGWALVVGCTWGAAAVIFAASWLSGLAAGRRCFPDDAELQDAARPEIGDRSPMAGRPLRAGRFLLEPAPARPRAGRAAFSAQAELDRDGNA